MEDNETFQRLQSKASEGKIKDGDYQERLPRVVAELFPTEADPTSAEADETKFKKGITELKLPQGYDFPQPSLRIWDP